MMGVGPGGVLCFIPQRGWRILRHRLDITLNKWKMRSKCKYTTLCAKMFAIIGLQRLTLKVLNII